MWKDTNRAYGSTWNSAQCYVAAWMGDGFRGEWIHISIHPHICMAESLCCPPETITTWLISYTPIQNKKFFFKKKGLKKGLKNKKWKEKRSVRNKFLLFICHPVYGIIIPAQMEKDKRVIIIIILQMHRGPRSQSLDMTELGYESSGLGPLLHPASLE